MGKQYIADRILVGTGIVDNGTDQLQIVGSLRSFSGYFRGQDTENWTSISSGTIDIGETGGANLRLQSRSIIFSNNVDGFSNIGTSGANDLSIITNNISRIYLTSGGNILVGTTTDNGIDKVQIAGSLNVNSIRIGRGNAGVSSNILIGNTAFQANAGGSNSIIIGYKAAQALPYGIHNIIMGSNAMPVVTLADYCTSIGGNSFYYLLNGYRNVALGYNAGRKWASGNLTLATNSIFIGYGAMANADNEINQLVIGHEAKGLGSNTTTIGNDDTERTLLRGRVLIDNPAFDDGVSFLNVNGPLNVKGGIRSGLRRVTNNTTLTEDDRFIEVISPYRIVYLPTATGNEGREYIIKHNTSGTTTVQAIVDQYIDGSNTYTLSTIYKYVSIVSNGVNQWLIIGNN